MQQANRSKGVIVMKKMKIGLLSLMALVGIAAAVPAYVSAAPADSIRNGVNAVGGNEQQNQRPLAQIVREVVNVVLFVLGAVAVIMIIIGGFRYVVSGGDSSSVTAAKNTIFYAVIGLIIAILAYAIVNFVVNSLT